MNETKIPVRNSEGYMDLTAHNAIENVMREQRYSYDENDARCTRLVKSLRSIIDLADFDLVTRFELRDRRTRRMYR